MRFLQTPFCPRPFSWIEHFWVPSCNCRVCIVSRITDPQALGPVGLPLGFRLLVVFGNEATLLLGYVRSHDFIPLGVTSRNKQETDGSRHRTAPPGAQNALCGFVFWKVRRILLLRLRQKISPIEAKERKLWSFEEGQSISSLESRQAWTRPEPQSHDFAVS